MKNSLLLLSLYAMTLLPIPSIADSCSWKFSKPSSRKNFDLYVTYPLSNGGSKTTFCGVVAGPIEDSIDHDSGKNLIEYQYTCLGGQLAVLTFLDVLVGSKSERVLFKIYPSDSFSVCSKE